MDYEKMWNELKDGINRVDAEINSHSNPVGNLHYMIQSILRLMDRIEDKENGGSVS